MQVNGLTDYSRALSPHFQDALRVGFFPLPGRTGPVDSTRNALIAQNTLTALERGIGTNRSFSVNDLGD